MKSEHSRTPFYYSYDHALIKGEMRMLMNQLDMLSELLDERYAELDSIKQDMLENGRPDLVNSLQSDMWDIADASDGIDDVVSKLYDAYGNKEDADDLTETNEIVKNLFGDEDESDNSKN